MMRRPTAVEPVKEMRSTFGDERELFADEMVGRGDDVDDTGAECPCARRSGGRGAVALNGVSGAGFSTTVLPVASA